MNVSQVPEFWELSMRRRAWWVEFNVCAVVVVVVVFGFCGVWWWLVGRIVNDLFGM